MEGLAAFFLESTFLGLWVFGWKRAAARRPSAVGVAGGRVGAMLSAAFIMAANSWMQHPVGYKLDPDTGRPLLNDIWDLFTNPVFIWGYIHVILAALVTGALVMLAVSAWQLRDGRVDTFKRCPAVARRAAAGVAAAARVGSQLGVIETTLPADEDRGRRGAVGDVSAVLVLALPDRRLHDPTRTRTKIIEVPHLLSILATLRWDGEVVGLNELQAQDEAEYGPGNYVPPVLVQYWSMRVMAYGDRIFLFVAVGHLAAAPEAADLRVVPSIAIWSVPPPFIVNTAGWVLTESGRQPWIVQGLMQTVDGVSPPSPHRDHLSLGVFVGSTSRSSWSMSCS